MRIQRILIAILGAITIFVLCPLYDEAFAVPPCSGVNLITQEFPVVATSAHPKQTRWVICWQMEKKYGLTIHYAEFTNLQVVGALPIKIFDDARISEIFVPYHSGNRFFDISAGNYSRVPLNNPDACPPSNPNPFSPSSPVIRKPLTQNPSIDPANPGPDVCEEVRDRGLAWMDHSILRRGEELVLWGVLNAVNYNYIIEWTFRDDGLIRGRVGSSGQVLPSDPLRAHVHNFTWRLDMDLNGNIGDSVKLATHTENLTAGAPSTGSDSDLLINNNTEGGVEWDPKAFHALEISDATLKNTTPSGQHHPSMYMLLPLRSGTSRHSEPFSQKDFWVTVWHAGELLAVNLPSTYVNGESTAGKDLVEWYTGSLHHMVRDEDGQSISGVWKGETLTAWTGFELVPHNLFGTTPLYP